MLAGQVAHSELAEWSCTAFSKPDCKIHVLRVLLIKLYGSTPGVAADVWNRLIGHYVKGKSGGHHQRKKTDQREHFE